MVLGSVAPGLEGAESTDAKSAGAAFEKLKGLAGTWQAVGTEGKKRTTYELVASGSTLLERYVGREHAFGKRDAYALSSRRRAARPDTLL